MQSKTLINNKLFSVKDGWIWVWTKIWDVKKQAGGGLLAVFYTVLQFCPSLSLTSFYFLNNSWTAFLLANP